MGCGLLGRQCWGRRRPSWFGLVWSGQLGAKPAGAGSVCVRRHAEWSTGARAGPICERLRARVQEQSAGLVVVGRQACGRQACS